MGIVKFLLFLFYCGRLKLPRGASHREAWRWEYVKQQFLRSRLKKLHN